MNNEDLSLISKALSDKTRICILKRIINEDVCACKLLESLDCCQSTLSHHMKVLTSSGIVLSKEEGKWTHYSFNKDLFNEFIDKLNKIKEGVDF